MTTNNELRTVVGGAVKAEGKGKIGGYLVLFGGPEKKDLDGEYFTSSTDFGPVKRSPVLYQHGYDDVLGKRVLAKSGALKKDDVGVWVSAQLSLRDDYEKAIYGLAKKGKLGWSSGTASYLVDRGSDGFLKSWWLGLDASLTPTPCEPDTAAVTLKSAVKSIKELSSNDLYDVLSRTLNEMLGPGSWPWVCDVFSDSLVYMIGNDLFECPYSMDGGKLSISLDEAQEVMRSTDYVPLDDGDGDTYAGDTYKKTISDEGMRLVDSSKLALAAANELAERCAGLKSLRAKDGRGLSAQRLTDLKRLREDLSRVDSSLSELISDGDFEAKALRLRAEILASEIGMAI